jgi:hypothetical protein
LSKVPLTLGPLVVRDHVVRRSGVRWLCDDGYVCRPGEVIAYCNIGLAYDGRGKPGPNPFWSEARDFQVAFAPRVGGRVTRAAESSLGGFLDLLPFYQSWSAEYLIGHVECDSGGEVQNIHAEGALRPLFLAGRRMTEIAEVRSGLLTGWHDRSRAWWGEGSDKVGTLLSLGICDQPGVIRGDRFAFLEMFEAVPGPAQVVYCGEDALVPCARVIAEQHSRTPAEFDEIAADFARTFPVTTGTPRPDDWIFAGCLLSALQRSPLTEKYPLLTRTGLAHTGPADAVLLSLSAEAQDILRHRRLGYALHCHTFRLAETGPGVRSWLRNNFEIVRRTPADIKRDYQSLIDAARRQSNAKFLIMNVMSTAGNETILNYAAFDPPMGDTLSNVRKKELNLMLHDLAREGRIEIVDLDAIAADMGALSHLPDGIHASGAMQTEIRSEILRILRTAGVTGFTAT